MQRRSLFTAAFVLLLAVCAIATAGASASSESAARAADASAPNGLVPVGMVSAQPARVIADLASLPDVAGPGAPANAFINRPGIPLAQYRAAKAAAAGRTSTKTPQPLSTNNLQGHHELTSQCAAGEACYFPPDINGAVGLNQVMVVTNSHFDIYTKSPSAPSLLLQRTLNAFTGYSGGDLFDPRIVYDQVWNRWVFVSDSFEQSGGGPQYVWLVVSNSSDATGSWSFYAIGLGNADHFADYPQVGFTQDAVIVTYNTFSNSNGAQTGARTFAVAKAFLYTGQGWSVPIFTLGTNGTVTPPIVIDQSPRAHELYEVPGSNVSNVFFQNPANGAYGMISSVTPISGVVASVPPDAPQPGPCSATSCNIDTSDARFVNDPIQYGTELWAVNTVALGSFSAPHWYDIWAEGASKNTVRQGGTVFASGTSYDWNASIAAREGGRAIMTWSYDDPGTGSATTTNPSMAMSGRTPTDATNTMNPPTTVYTSPSTLQGNYDSRFGAQRWGDTSSVQFDPGTSRAFGFNETVLSGGNSWSTHQGVLSLS